MREELVSPSTSNQEDRGDRYGPRRPRTAFVLCQIGAVYNLGIGSYLLLTLQSTRYTAPFSNVGALGVVSTGLGAVVLILGGLLYLRPDQHVRWALVVVVLSVCYWAFTALVAGQTASAWAAFGSAYSLSGGILGLLWKTPIPGSRM